MDLSVLDISYKWNHVICGLLWLTSSLNAGVFKVHSCCSVNQCPIPFYGSVIVHCVDIHILSIHQLMGICVVSALRLLWMMLLWTFVYRLHKFSVLLGRYLGVQCLGHVVSIFNSLKNCQTLFYSDCTFYILASSVGDLQFLCVLAKHWL